MYGTVFKEDPLDPSRGQRYRDRILLPGASRDDMDLVTVGSGSSCGVTLAEHWILQHFLGRPPNSEAFIKALFGESDTPSL